MDALIPTLESFRAAIAMISETDPLPGTVEDAVLKDLQATATMLDVEEYVVIAARFHTFLHHGPAKKSCLIHYSALSSLMAKMFTAGYSAGRQEVIDSEVERIGAV